MAHNEANVVHFDSEPGWQRNVREAVQRLGQHVVVAAAASHQEADEIMRRIEDGSLKADILVFDDNLVGSPKYTGAVSTLVERAKAMDPPLPTILLTPEATPPGLEGLVDYPSPFKRNFSSGGLHKVIDSVMAQKDPAATGAPIPS